MTKSTITREQLIKKAQEQIEFCRHTKITGEGRAHVNQCAALFEIALAAMDSEPVEMPLDYLQGHKDGLEWSAQLAEANHPETGDWLYDDPIELAKAIRKGPDMPPEQPVEDSEPDRNPVLAYADSYRDMAKQGVESVPIWSVITDIERNIAPLYRHAQPAPVVPEEMTPEMMRSVQLNSELGAYAASNPSGAYDLFAEFWKEACRAAMLAAATQSPGSDPATVPGKWIPVSEQMPENDGAYLCWDNRYVTTYAFIFGAWQANQFVAKNITHWMPLPNPPKE